MPLCLCGVCVWCRLELEQERKWVVENHQGQQELVVTVTDPKHSVYIYNCSGSVVQVGMEQPCVKAAPASCRRAISVHSAVTLAYEHGTP